MPIHLGEYAYGFSQGSCSASGVSWSDAGLDAAINEVAASILHDDPGQAVMSRCLSGLPETGFDRSGAARLFAGTRRMENWQVGEWIGRLYLTACRACSFPWPAEWDERKIGSSLPGADLVGFCLDSSGECFAFGEVKTSADSNRPPRVMGGPDGLIQQLRNLRDSRADRDTLVWYLARRSDDPAWCAKFQSAFGRYMRDALDVMLLT